MYNIEEVTAFTERAAARVREDKGFHELRDELGSSRSSTIPRDTSLDVSFEEEPDFVKVRLLDETFSVILLSSC